MPEAQGPGVLAWLHIGDTLGALLRSLHIIEAGAANFVTQLGPNRNGRE